MDTINEIANPKGWQYKKRKAKHERAFGYVFIGKVDNDRYRCHIQADNPVDAANRLRPIREAVRDFRCY